MGGINFANPTARDRDDDARSGRQWWLIAAVFAVLAIGASLLTPAGRHQWALSIFRQPTHYTTLYFNDAGLLPTNAVAHEGLPLTFTIGNYQGHPVNYRYVVASSDGIYSRVLARSTIRVPQDAAWLVNMTIYPRCKLSPCRIAVSLPGHPEHIDFLVNLTYRARPGGQAPSVGSRIHS